MNIISISGMPGTSSDEAKCYINNKSKELGFSLNRRIYEANFEINEEFINHIKDINGTDKELELKIDNIFETLIEKYEESLDYGFYGIFDEYSDNSSIIRESNKMINKFKQTFLYEGLNILKI